jgi:hypothetical protein
VIDRQRIVGWILIAVSVAYLAYFWKVRLFEPGPEIARKEWFSVITSIVVLMIGTANVRLAAMRRNRRGPGSRE